MIDFEKFQDRLTANANDFDPIIMDIRAAYESLQREKADLVGMLGAIPKDYCPQCEDGSGAYYDNMGEVSQCQWCDIRDKALADTPAKELGEECVNCGTRLPEGCSGQFKDDGDHCLLNRADPPNPEGYYPAFMRECMDWQPPSGEITCSKCNDLGLRAAMCCDGSMCGCMGMPTDFIDCSCGNKNWESYLSPKAECDHIGSRFIRYSESGAEIHRCHQCREEFTPKAEGESNLLDEAFGDVSSDLAKITIQPEVEK